MASHTEYEHKFKVIRLADWTAMEDALNDFKLGAIRDIWIAMPDYRLIVLTIQYTIEYEVQDPEPKPAATKKEAKSDSAAK